MSFAGMDDFIIKITEALIRGAFSILKSIGKLFFRAASTGSKPKTGTKSEDTETTTSPTANEKLMSTYRHGIFFGVQEGKYIIKSESQDGHVMVVGGSGSGKTSCIAIPTLRRWKGQVFAIDIKGELYEKTKKQRSISSIIRVFNPQDENAYGYNPYMFLKDSRNPAQEARAIAQSLIPLPPNIDNPFWIESAQSILTGAILYYY